MTIFSAHIGFVAIARPTFDIPLATEKTAEVRATLTDADLDFYGLETLVMDAEGVQAAIDIFAEDKPDMLLILQASFADSTMVRQIAEAVDVPLLLWALPEEHIGGRLRLNSFCGINLAGHSLKRADIQYDYIYADPDNASAVAKVKNYANAALITRKLRTAKIGRIGENPDGFETCLFDADNLKARVGVEIVQLDLQTIFDGVRTADTQAVATLEVQLRQQLSGYDSVNQEEARNTLGTFVTMKDIAEQKNLQGIAVRCWPEFFTDLGCSACGAMSMMNNSQIPCSCETDVNGTITQLILQWMSNEPAFGTDLVSFDVADDIAILWHCGLAPMSMADPDYTPEAALHSNRQKPLLMQFPLKPGRVTIARLSEATGELRLVIGGGEMLKRPSAFTGTSGAIRFDSGAQIVMDTILNEGLEHHISITYGDYSETLLALAKMLNLPVLRL